MDDEKTPGLNPAPKTMSFAEARAMRETYLAMIARLDYERMVRRHATNRSDREAGATVQGSVEHHNPDPRVKGKAWSGVIHNAGAQIDRVAGSAQDPPRRVTLNPKALVFEGGGAWPAAANEVPRIEDVLDALACAVRAAWEFRYFLDIAPPQSLKHDPFRPHQDVRESKSFFEAAELLNSAQRFVARVSGEAGQKQGERGERTASSLRGDAEATFARLLAQLKRAQGDAAVAPDSYLRRPFAAEKEKKVVAGEPGTPVNVPLGSYTIRCSHSGVRAKIVLWRDGSVELEVGQPNPVSDIYIRPDVVRRLIDHFAELSQKAT